MTDLHLHNHHHHYHLFKKPTNPDWHAEKRKIILPVLMGTGFRFITEALGVFWAIYFTEKGLSGAEIGTIFALLTITGLLITLPSGLFSDRIKAKYLIMIGLGLTIIQFFLSSLSNTFWFLALLFFLGGLGQNMHNTSIDSLFYKNLNKQLKDKEIGFYLTIRFLIGGIGVIIGGLALSLFSFAAVLKTLGLFLIIFLFLSKKLPDTPSSHPNLSSYKKDLWHKEVLIFLAIIFLFALHGGAELTTLGPYLKSNLKLPTNVIGIYAGFGIMNMGLIAYHVSRSLQKKTTSTKKLLHIGLYCSAIGLLTMAYNHPVISFIGRIVHVSGDSTLLVILYHDISSLFPTKRIGGDSSLITLIIIGGSFVGSLIFGPLGTKIGYQYTLISSSLFTFFSLLFAIYQQKNSPQKIPLKEPIDN